MSSNSRPRRLPPFTLQALHIVTLTAVALTARLYAALGDKPMFFSVRQAGARELLLFVLIVSAVLPGLLVGLLWGLGRFGARTAAASFLILLGALLAIIALPLCKRIPLFPDPAACGWAAVLGIAATLAYWRFFRLRTVVSILAPIAVISPAIYLFATPTSQLLLHRADPASVPVRAGNPVPVVMVVFDEFSGTSLVDGGGRINAGLYPNFAALAGQSIWFRNASSVAAETEAALPGILTGNLPQPGIHELDSHEYPNNLFTLLRDSHAFEFSVFEPVTDFCPKDLRGQPARWSLGTRLKSLLIDAAVLDAILILPRHWPLALPDVSGKFCNFAGAADSEEPDLYYNRREILEGVIDRIQPGPKPGLFFIHSVLPHAPWNYLPSGKQYGLEGLPPEIRDCDAFAAGAAGLDRQSKRWPNDPVIVAQAQQRYLLQAQFVDRELGRLLRHLKEVGLYDSSLIVITADHGVSFLPGQPFRGIGQAINAETLSIPLFVKLPARHEGRVSDRNIEEVDILPTIADVLKIPLPWATRGSSALDDRLPQRPGKEACISMVHWATWKYDDWHDWLSQKDQAIRRRLERFAASDSPRPPAVGHRVGHHVPVVVVGGTGEEKGVRADAFFRFGPYSAMIGRPLANCRVASASGGRYELFRPERLAQVDLEQDRLPLLIGGRVRGSDENLHGVDLAVAVNGTIRGVARSFSVPGYGQAWTALLPEDSLRPGGNEIKLYKLSGSGTAVELELLEAQLHLQ